MSVHRHLAGDDAVELVEVERPPGRRSHAAERCDLCGAALPKSHDHLVGASRHGSVRCACAVCATLFPEQLERSDA